MAIINVLRGDFGSVRVDFAKPFSVQVCNPFFNHLLTPMHASSFVACLKNKENCGFISSIQSSTMDRGHIYHRASVIYHRASVLNMNT